MITSSDGPTLGQSGLIIPENIPGDDLKPVQLTEVAETLRTAGTGAVTNAEAAETSWNGLPTVLESPQGPVIYAALGTPSSTASTISDKLHKVATALDEYATALVAIKSTFSTIKEDAVAFRATITWDERVWVSPQETKEYESNGLAMVSSTSYSTSYSTGSSLSDVVDYLRGRGESVRTRNGRPQILAPWYESSEHIDQNNALMDRLADAYTTLQNAEADCANAINRQRDVCVADVEKIEAWQLKQSGENTVVLPWGSRRDEDRNCGESFWWGVGSAGKEALEGAAGLIGYNGVRGDWSWEQAGQSWLGAAQGIGALLVITSPPLMLLGRAGVPVLSDAVNMGDEMVKGLLAWDVWAENPSEAAGRVIVNVGSMFIPGAGEVAAAIKALSAGSRVVDLAGDAARLGDAALGGVNKLDGLLPKLDGLVGDAASTTVKLDDLAHVGTKLDGAMPDRDLLQVGAKPSDATPPPSSYTGPGAHPHVDAPPAGPVRPPHVGGDDAPTPVKPGGDDAPAPVKPGGQDTPGPVKPGGDDAPGPVKPGGDDAPGPVKPGGDDTPGGGDGGGSGGTGSDGPGGSGGGQHTPPHTNLDAPPVHAGPETPQLPLDKIAELDAEYRLPSGAIDPARFDEWAGKVSEAYPTLDPGDVKGIYDYTTNAYRDMNEYLRFGTIDGKVPSAAEAASWEARITASTEGLAKLPAQPGIGYRGVGFDDDFLAQFTEGGTWSDKGFSSSSTDPAVAANFAASEAAGGKIPGIIEVQGRTGANVSPISRFGHEAEVLYQRGTVYDVVSKTQDANGVWRIVLREVPAK